MLVAVLKLEGFFLDSRIFRKEAIHCYHVIKAFEDTISILLELLISN